MVNWLINSCDVDSHLRIYIPDKALANLSTEGWFLSSKGKKPVLTFFTVRGRSGKTVLSAAFASYVSYILGKRAMVLDFDGPEYNLYMFTTASFLFHHIALLHDLQAAHDY